MSNPPRRLGGAPKKRSWRRPILIFSVILFLFLFGTVIVLSTVVHYFGVSKNAFLTEDEVPWRPEDAIPALHDLVPQEEAADLAKRQTAADFAEILDDDVYDGNAPAATGSSAVASSTADGLALAPASASTAKTGASDDSVWGADGKGTGGYWMRKDWDGRVADTDSWERLYNISIRPGEKMPRIIHQTWKSDVLPDKWRKSFRECREGMPDYEYMLWTDELSRNFIKTHYPDQLYMFDNYPYPIQRADAIRYFILHHFGGIYMDLDMGCRRRMDLLLQGDWEVVLPITKPVGVSNDLIISPKGSAFLDNTIHGLAAFNHDYILHYPTVMFSTGPMFLSAQLAIYSAAHPVTPTHPIQEVRVLPKSLYGKNAPQEEVPHSFFSHFYGSSWHANDAGFITFLGKWGKGLMIVGAVLLVIAVLRLLFSKSKARLLNSGPQYQLLPVTYDDGRTSPTSSFTSGPLSPISDSPPALGDALRRAGNLILAAPAALVHGSGSGRRQKGWLYFVPAIFHPTPTQTHGRRRTASEASQLPRHRPRPSGSSALGAPYSDTPHPLSLTHAPPPYEQPSDMDEVDAFLKQAGEGVDVGVAEENESGEAESSASATGSRTRQRQMDKGWEGDAKWGDWRHD